MAKILIIDDEPAIRKTMRDILEYESHEVEEAATGTEGAKKASLGSFDLVFCDIKMPGKDGIEVLTETLQEVYVPFVMISGHGTIETAVEAIKKGAFDFIAKPIDLNRLLITVRNALDKDQLEKVNKTYKRKTSEKYEMIGNSPAMMQMQDLVEKVAPTSARVLITGENGTGKELVAHHLHDKSPRAGAPFIEVNCAAIPSELIESQLFGHEKGSFTSAIKQRKGDFEQANGGTLFLDEIGDMSLSAQAKVLRALQENKITRIGGEKDITVDVRVIAATNKDLKNEIANGKFREDLYHRLSVILIHVPTLDERKEDIPLLVKHFLKIFTQEQGKTKMTIDKEAVDLLQETHWSGNIRQLRNVIERLCILCEKKITAKDVERYA